MHDNSFSVRNWLMKDWASLDFFPHQPLRQDFVVHRLAEMEALEAIALLALHQPYLIDKPV